MQNKEDALNSSLLIIQLYILLNNEVHYKKKYYRKSHPEQINNNTVN